MESRNQETAEQLREIINKYSSNPEYVNAFYTKQEAIDALNRYYKQRYLNFRKLAEQGVSCQK